MLTILLYIPKIMKLLPKGKEDLLPYLKILYPVNNKSSVGNPKQKDSKYVPDYHFIIRNDLH